MLETPDDAETLFTNPRSIRFQLNFSPPKVVFLDVDGVISTGKDIVEQDRVGALNAECVARLQHIVSQTKCLVVLSSDWRYSTDRLKDLEEAGIVLHDMIGTECDNRNDEIMQWLTDPESSSSEYKIAIVDDNVECFVSFESDDIFHIDRSVGLTDKDAERIISHLNAK